MTAADSYRALVEASVESVLPTFGLAYFVDSQERTWAATRHTEGPGLETLTIGQTVRLQLGRISGSSGLSGFVFVRRYDVHH